MSAVNYTGFDRREGTLPGVTLRYGIVGFEAVPTSGGESCLILACNPR